MWDKSQFAPLNLKSVIPATSAGTGDFRLMLTNYPAFVPLCLLDYQ
ncbi:hypothetical protein Q7L46_04780 [Pediococcus acidilactici]|nr:hypothetical protein [Pediococcus acidilactici]MDO7802297.1 hypothetical protein [Pediococcus acidilactici]